MQKTHVTKMWDMKYEIEHRSIEFEVISYFIKVYIAGMHLLNLWTDWYWLWGNRCDLIGKSLSIN